MGFLLINPVCFLFDVVNLDEEQRLLKPKLRFLRSICFTLLKNSSPKQRRFFVYCFVAESFAVHMPEIFFNLVFSHHHFTSNS